jgi:hypothetical protein
MVKEVKKKSGTQIKNIVDKASTDKISKKSLVIKPKVSYSAKPQAKESVP